MQTAGPAWADECYRVGRTSELTGNYLFTAHSYNYIYYDERGDIKVIDMLYLSLSQPEKLTENCFFLCTFLKPCAFAFRLYASIRQLMVFSLSAGPSVLCACFMPGELLFHFFFPLFFFNALLFLLLFLQAGVRLDIQVALITLYSKPKYLQCQSQIVKGKVSIFLHYRIPQENDFKIDYNYDYLCLFLLLFLYS